MSAVRFQSSYNGIIFNRVYGGSDPDNPATLVDAYRESDYRLEAFDDSEVPVRDFAEPRQMMEGSEPNQAYETMRVIRGEGTILGASYADLEEKVWYMRSQFALSNVRRVSAAAAGFPDDPTGVLPFVFTHDSGAGPVQKMYWCRPPVGRPSLQVAMKGGKSRPFAFTLVAYDPRAYSPAWASAGLGAITNNGSAVVYPQFRVTTGANGHASYRIRNDSTGDQVTLNLATAGAQQFWLMTEAGDIIAPDRSSRSYLKSVATEFLANLFLLPGSNSLTHDNPTGITEVLVFWRHAWA